MLTVFMSADVEDVEDVLVGRWRLERMRVFDCDGR